jgi:hypothetical protein
MESWQVQGGHSGSVSSDSALLATTFGISIVDTHTILIIRQFGHTEFARHLPCFFPGLAGNAFDERLEHRTKSGVRGGGVKILGLLRGQQGAHIGEEGAVIELRKHALVGLRARYHLFGCLQVFAKQRDDARMIKIAKHGVGMGEVNEVPPLLPLQERAKLGGKDLFLGDGFFTASTMACASS